MLTNLRNYFSKVKTVFRNDTATETRQVRLSRVKKWAYQLQDVDVHAVARSDADLIVVDASRDGSTEGAWTPDEVAIMQSKGRRIVLSYLSIGEAERYRAYWGSSWQTGAPSWLGPENPEWKGNYKVKFWYTDWKVIVKREISRLIGQGFDGAYLDIIDAYEYYNTPSAMSRFVIEIALYARSLNPNFIIVPQNGDGILDTQYYMQHIDALGREDLVFDGDGDKNPIENCEYSVSILKPLLALGKPVFCVEYMTKTTGAVAHREVTAQLHAYGVIPLLVSSRSLDTLSL